MAQDRRGFCFRAQWRNRPETSLGHEQGLTRDPRPMIFPSWLEAVLDAAQQSLPVLLLIGAAGVLWWRSLRPAR